MRKIWGFVLAFLGIILAFQVTSTNVSASSKYQIKKYNIEANVKKNGDVELTQRLNYHFEGDFHGAFYNQSLKGVKDVTQPKIYVDTGFQTLPIRESNSGANNTFKFTKTNKKLKLKVYHEMSTGDASFIYKYTLKGLVRNYNDTAVLNWRVLYGWNNILKDVKITVNLPQQNIPQLQAWSHGPLNGHNKVDRKKGRVIITVPELPSDEMIEARMLFPVSVTADNKNVVNKNMKQKVRAEEKQLAIQANQTRQKQTGIYWSLMVFGLLIILGIYLYKYVTMRKRPGTKHQIPTPLYHSFDAPEFLPSFSKVILERLHDGDTSSLTADMMNEVGHRRMKIEKVGTTFEITALVPPTNDFFKYMINDIGDGKKVTLREIRHEAQDFDGKQRVTKNFEDWASNAAKNREQYLDLHNIDIVSGFSLAAISTDIIAAIMFVITLLFNRPMLWPGITLAILALLVWGVYYLMSRKITPYTDKGEIAVNQIRAFKRMLEDIDDIKMAEVGDIILWEQFIPYAIAFGISEKVIKALRVNFTPEQLGQSAVLVNYIGFSTAFGAASGTGFQNSFAGAIGASGSASITGGSGGFSGGSSGGFGGGSGGAF